jgi:hypothetical protein
VTQRGVVLYDFAAVSLASLLYLPDLFLLHSAHFKLGCCCCAAGAGSDDGSDIVTQRGVVLYDFAAVSLACLLYLPDLFLLHSADFMLVPRR